MITINASGNFAKTEKFLKNVRGNPLTTLDKYGREGVAALSAATPVDSGLTANSWFYEIEVKGGVATIYFKNTNVQGGWAPIAILLQYGHATRNGGWVQGRDYINPAIQRVFDKMANDAWREVTNK